MSALEAMGMLMPAMVGLCLLGIWQVIEKAKLEARVKHLESRLKTFELLMGAALGSRRGNK